MTPLLEARSVCKRFGGIQALQDVSFGIAPGEIYGLIGPNGAGKTSLFNVLTGIYPVTSGTFLFDGRPLAGLRPDRVAAAGIARTFQNIRLFANVSALENVMIGRHVRTQAGVLGAVLRDPATLREEAAIERRALELLDYVGIRARANEAAGGLPYGDQRRLEIARALATEPRLLALDEPAAGMNPSERQALAKLIERIRADGVTVLLIEHDVRLVMGICDRVLVLDYGERIAEGAPLAVSHGTRYPIVQGPMTRVSDTAAFAASVAEAGALPFLALALMRAPEADKLVAETKARLGDRPWVLLLLAYYVALVGAYRALATGYACQPGTSDMAP